MSKVKNAIMFMGLGALATTIAFKVANSNNCSVNDLMKKEKKMIKNFKNKFMN